MQPAYRTERPMQRRAGALHALAGCSQFPGCMCCPVVPCCYCSSSLAAHQGAYDACRASSSMQTTQPSRTGGEPSKQQAKAKAMAKVAELSGVQVGPRPGCVLQGCVRIHAMLAASA